MYEFIAGGLGALGWSDMTGYPTCAAVTGGGVKKCFTTVESDRSCARNCGCIETSESCTTSSGNGGTAWCCPRNCPVAGSGGCTPPSQNLICDLSRVDIGTLSDARSRAVWTVKNRLCSQRIDPGAVDGNPNARMAEALSTFQARQGLPVTGQADATTLRLLGFSAADATSYANAVSASPAALVSSIEIPWGLVGATSVASIFMLYAFWRFIKSRSRR